jgi:hypothetical protein
MLACADGLRQQYGEEIEIRSTFVRFYGQKYTAIDFAAGVVVIGGVSFNIDAAVAAHPDFEINSAVAVRHSGRLFPGYKRRGGGGEAVLGAEEEEEDAVEAVRTSTQRHVKVWTRDPLLN